MKRNHAAATAATESCRQCGAEFTTPRGLAVHYARSRSCAQSLQGASLASEAAERRTESLASNAQHQKRSWASPPFPGVSAADQQQSHDAGQQSQPSSSPYDEDEGEGAAAACSDTGFDFDGDNDCSTTELSQESAHNSTAAQQQDTVFGIQWHEQHASEVPKAPRKRASRARSQQFTSQFGNDTEDEDFLSSAELGADGHLDQSSRLDALNDAALATRLESHVAAFAADDLNTTDDGASQQHQLQTETAGSSRASAQLLDVMLKHGLSNEGMNDMLNVLKSPHVDLKTMPSNAKALKLDAECFVASTSQSALPELVQWRVNLSEFGLGDLKVAPDQACFYTVDIAHLYTTVLQTCTSADLTYRFHLLEDEDGNRCVRCCCASPMTMVLQHAHAAVCISRQDDSALNLRSLSSGVLQPLNTSCFSSCRRMCCRIYKDVHNCKAWEAAERSLRESGIIGEDDVLFATAAYSDKTMKRSIGQISYWPIILSLLNLSPDLRSRTETKMIVGYIPHYNKPSGFNQKAFSDGTARCECSLLHVHESCICAHHQLVIVTCSVASLAALCAVSCSGLPRRMMTYCAGCQSVTTLERDINGRPANRSVQFYCCMPPPIAHHL